MLDTVRGQHVLNEQVARPPLRSASKLLLEHSVMIVRTTGPTPLGTRAPYRAMSTNGTGTGGLMPEYKVITQKDRYFRGKFNPEKLELAINAYAQEGWRLVSMASAEFPGFGKERVELVVVMERG